MSELAAGEPISLPHLRSLIGLRVSHQGTPCRVVEVLESPPSLVLEPLIDPRAAGNNASRIMANVHGYAGEYGVESRIVRILSDDQTSLDDGLLELEILD